MGIKHFFSWFRKNFKNRITEIKNSTESPSKNIDNFLIDMNSIFHNCAQKVFKYGAYKPLPSLLAKAIQTVPNTLHNQIKCFEEICETVNNLVKLVKPQKRLILCIDGPAPISKQRQQRARRFVTSKLSKEENRAFDSNCITPGTKFMDSLSKYIDWYIRRKISSKLKDDENWKHLEIVFSNEKAAGEGEQKLINYIRKYGVKNESYCLNGMDADLIMLALSVNLPNFYILRDEMMSHDVLYHFIDVSGTSEDLVNLMRWESKEFDSERCIHDFILMCFTVGNDFLPHIPGIEISEGGIDMMFDSYREVCSKFGHITKKTEHGIKFHRKTLALFLRSIGEKERDVLSGKANHGAEYYYDELLEKNTELISQNESTTFLVNIENYRKDYYEKNFEDDNIETICHQYLKGMQWVLSYYTQGVPDWKWQYVHHYAPFSYDLAKHCLSFTFENFRTNSPTLPFVQLLCTMPPSSSYLLPEPLCDLVSHTGELKEIYPKDFEIDLAGKKQEWEGIVLLPTVNYQKVERIYKKYVSQISAKDLRRNILGKTFVYNFFDEESIFNSFYGNFICNVSIKMIDI